MKYFAVITNLAEHICFVALPRCRTNLAGHILGVRPLGEDPLLDDWSTWDWTYCDSSFALCARSPLGVSLASLYCIVHTGSWIFVQLSLLPQVPSGILVLALYLCDCQSVCWLECASV